MTQHVSHPATYRSVAILRPGTFTDATGVPVCFTADDLARIADNYDPAYHCAALNLDHADSGPAQGFVADLAWDGAYLRADIAGVPPELARELDAGRYPCRSAEVYADLDGRGPYLRAVALLGAKPPAVKGLPPLPGPAGVPVPRPPTGGTPDARANYRLDAVRQSVRQPHSFTIYTEVDMPDPVHPPRASLAEPAPVPASPAPPVQSAPEMPLETIRLAEENLRLQEEAQRLGEENRAFKASQARREVSFFMAELRAAGRLTPALERSGVEAALLTAQEQPLLVNMPDGSRVPLAAVLRELLQALPVSFALGEAAPVPAAAQAAALSAEQLAVIAALGLSREEYAACAP